LAWAALRRATDDDFKSSPETKVSREILDSAFNALMTLPPDFTPLKKVQKIIDEKIKLLQTNQEIDWATGELLAYATLLAEGNDVRMSGQDVERGTFSHRHAVIYDEKTNARHNRLNFISETQSPLSWVPPVFKALISHLTFIEQDDYKLYLQCSFSQIDAIIDLLNPTKCNFFFLSTHIYIAVLVP
jgi:2-oxoglutarate dehydrogenase complex dehydrogenase (E1) component-like enzyme